LAALIAHTPARVDFAFRTFLYSGGRMKARKSYAL
jgi:hypothetical protein